MTKLSINFVKAFKSSIWAFFSPQRRFSLFCDLKGVKCGESSLPGMVLLSVLSKGTDTKGNWKGWRTDIELNWKGTRVGINGPTTGPTSESTTGLGIEFKLRLNLKWNGNRTERKLKHNWRGIGIGRNRTEIESVLNWYWD